GPPAFGEAPGATTVVPHAPAPPPYPAHHAPARAVCKVRAAPCVAVHPRVGHHALEYAALHVEAVAADMLDGHVADCPVVDPAVVAVGDDLDAVALSAVALDREVRESDVAQVDARAS